MNYSFNQFIDNILNIISTYFYKYDIYNNLYIEKKMEQSVSLSLFSGKVCSKENLKLMFCNCEKNNIKRLSNNNLFENIINDFEYIDIEIDNSL